MEQIFKIGIFSIPTKVVSGFGIFKENRDNPNEIGMVGHSEVDNGMEQFTGLNRSFAAKGHTSLKCQSLRDEETTDISG